MRYCRNCGNTGHNRRTCPSRSQEAKNADKEYHNKYRRKSRRCSFCYENEHDRRKCEKLKSERNVWITENAAYRSRFLEDMKKAGIGIGAIVKRISWQSQTTFYFIKDIRWDYINQDDHYSYPFRVLVIGEDCVESGINAPSYFGRNDKEREYYINNDRNMVAENPAMPDSIKPPIEWFDGTTVNFPKRLK